MRSFTLLILAFVFGTFAVAATAFLVMNPEKAALAVDKRVHEFGAVRQNETCQATFLLQNESDSPIHILRADADCSCTVPVVRGTKVAPGSSTELQVTYESGGGRGPIQQSVHIYYLSEAENQLRMFPVAVTANIQPDYVVEPDALRFSQGQTESRTVAIRESELDDLQIANVYARHAAFDLDWEAEPAGEGWTVDVMFDPDRWPHEESGLTQIVIETNSTREPVFRLDVAVN